MKQQNEHSKTKYYTAYDDKKPTQNRCLEAIKKASDDGRCWWIEAYLRGVYFTRTRNNGLPEGRVISVSGNWRTGE